jgi:hypothetical protein
MATLITIITGIFSTLHFMLSLTVRCLAGLFNALAVIV